MLAYFYCCYLEKKRLTWISTSHSYWQVSIEYGLCEVLNGQALREFSPKETESWFPNISDLEDELPKGCIDHDYNHLLEQV